MFRLATFNTQYTCVRLFGYLASVCERARELPNTIFIVWHSFSLLSQGGSGGGCTTRTAATSLLPYGILSRSHCLALFVVPFQRVGRHKNENGVILYIIYLYDSSIFSGLISFLLLQWFQIVVISNDGCLFAIKLGRTDATHTSPLF